MSQIVFKLPTTENPGPTAQKHITEGWQAREHICGRGDNPYPDDSRRARWWDEGWCQCELECCAPENREELEVWLAGGNE